MDSKEAYDYVGNMQKVKDSDNKPWRRRGERIYSSYLFMTLELAGG
jgi:hypothetical protein